MKSARAFVAVMALAMTACTTTGSGKVDGGGLDQGMLSRHIAFEPIDPINYDPKRYAGNPIPAECMTAGISKEIMKQRRDCWLSALPDGEDYVSVRDLTYGANAGFMGATISHKGSSYEIVSQWARFLVVQPTDANGIALDGEMHKVGVGARVYAQIKTNTSGLNLGDLLGIAAAAEKGQVDGTLLFTIQGIHGKAVDTYTPRVSTLNQDNMRKVLDAIQSLKTLLHNDSDIYLTGRVLAMRRSGSSKDGLPKADAASGEGVFRGLSNLSGALGEKSFADLSRLLGGSLGGATGTTGSTGTVTRQGWLYVGAFDANQKPRDIVTLDVAARPLGGTTAKTRTATYLRSDYPKYPDFALAGILAVVPEGKSVNILRVVSSSDEHVWALVEYR